jgi:hypothetical protein
VLALASSLTQFISHLDNGVTAAWAFACRYRLEPVLKEVEARIQSGLPSTLGEVDVALQYAANLPASSSDLGCSSLMRMLHETSTKSHLLQSKQDKLSRAVRENSNEIRMSMEKCAYTFNHSRALTAWKELQTAADI